MPRMSGKEALDAIRALRPGVRAIFMSGYAAEIMADPKGAGPGVVCLSKPLLPQELLRQVRAALDA
jgi:CheY-like chemotaxis protein